MRVTPKAVNSPVRTGWFHEVVHEALRGEVVDLVGLGCLDGIHQRGLVEKIAREEIDLIQKVGDAVGDDRARTSSEAVDLVTFLEKEFGKVRAVLSRDAGDECLLHE